MSFFIYSFLLPGGKPQFLHKMQKEDHLTILDFFFVEEQTSFYKKEMLCNSLLN